MAGTTVNSGGSLELNAVTLIDEQLAVAGTGFGNTGRGAVVGLAGGTSTLTQDSLGATLVTMTGATTIGVESGGTLTFIGEVGQSGGNQSLTKTLGGRLSMQGSVPNTYLGNTTISEGQLQLNKSGTLANEKQRLTFGG